MVNIPLGTDAYRRTVAREPVVKVINRYFEENPTNQENGASLLVRPSLQYFLADIDTGPVRGIYTQPGAFDDDLFVVIDQHIYRISLDLNKNPVATQIAGTYFSTNQTDLVTMAASEDYLFLCDGSVLLYYDGVNVLQIATPDDIGVVSLGYIAGYIILVMAGGQRFYWIEPGEVTIDPLNFAEAERAPDPVLNVTVISDQFWLFGAGTTEVWFPSGDFAAPFQRIQGRLFEDGIVEGTAIQVKNQVILVGNDYKVYSVAGGPQRISNSGVEERIREAMKVDFLGE